MKTTKRHAIEIHINTSPEFTKTHGKKVRAIGGEYGEARG